MPRWAGQGCERRGFSDLATARAWVTLGEGDGMSRGIEKYLSNTTLVFTPEMGLRLPYVAHAMGIREMDLAKLLGVSQGVLSNVKLGKSRVLSRDNGRTFVTTGHVRQVLGVKAFEYLVSESYAEDFQPHRYVIKDKFGNVTTSHKKDAKL
jgi:hypothetical protein